MARWPEHAVPNYTSVIYEKAGGVLHPKLLAVIFIGIPFTRTRHWRVFAGKGARCAPQTRLGSLLLVATTSTCSAGIHLPCKKTWRVVAWAPAPFATPILQTTPSVQLFSLELTWAWASRWRTIIASAFACRITRMRASSRPTLASRFCNSATPTCLEAFIQYVTPSQPQSEQDVEILKRRNELY